MGCAPTRQSGGPLVTTYRACLRAGRDLVIDLYGADVAAVTGRTTIPHIGPDWPRVHVYVPQRQRILVKESGEFDRVEAIKTVRLFPENLAADPTRYVLYGAYQSDIPRLLKGPGIGAVVWSMWDGYLAATYGVTLRQHLDDAGVPLVHLHTSGHAAPVDLKRLVAALTPGRVVPIHTDAAGHFGAEFPSTERHDDGTWWAVR